METTAAPRTEDVAGLPLGQVAQETSSTTTVVPRIVGEPLPSWVVLAASAALLAVILVAGLLVQRRQRRTGGGSRRRSTQSEAGDAV